jgi:hypothetical protein
MFTRWLLSHSRKLFLTFAPLTGEILSGPLKGLSSPIKLPSKWALCVYLSVCLSVCLFVPLCLFVCLSVCDKGWDFFKADVFGKCTCLFKKRKVIWSHLIFWSCCYPSPPSLSHFIRRVKVIRQVKKTDWKNFFSKEKIIHLSLEEIFWCHNQEILINRKGSVPLTSSPK